ncbi:hypothetical protein SODALDRAFT_335581 [Sodiomyces alkalinus F11]|uniref:AoPex11B-like protein n=1 Tax=Sodiomyces alkalinus (strain CBS 110278 / VKM F-3762 / F11) TaxID=1314773 RepID=A0A3N2PPQ1_SODAK|nr:hypothetical protein SODALDRAFT_335581 [Sodiomyces alkalinus F11]ROT36487.1 hypothetical protein SODALDRAFT_335581 [Sodiomyces alkalinus F11]
MSPRRFQQFILLGTDLFGLERILRGFHAAILILIGFPTLIPFLTSTASPSAVILDLLDPLKAEINLIRRAIRTFKFLEAFAASASIVSSLRAGPQPAEVHLDLHALLFLGAFGFLETVTLPDMVADVTGQPGLGVFGAERAGELNTWALKSWFCGLICLVLSAALKIRRLVLLSSAADADAATSSRDEKREGESKEKARERRQQEEKERGEERARRVRKLARKMVADMVDLVIPAATVGWISVEPGLVAVVMLCTSWLTGMDVWEKYGDQLAAKGGQKKMQ